MEVYNSSKNSVKDLLPYPNNPSNKIDQYMACISKSLCKIEYENKITTGFLIKLFKGGKEFFLYDDLRTCHKKGDD